MGFQPMDLCLKIEIQANVNRSKCSERFVLFISPVFGVPAEVHGLEARAT